MRVLGSRLTGKGLVFAAGLRWAIKEGARVVNLSLSTGREDYFGLFHEIADEAAFAGVGPGLRGQQRPGADLSGPVLLGHLRRRP